MISSRLSIWRSDSLTFFMAVPFFKALMFHILDWHRVQNDKKTAAPMVKNHLWIYEFAATWSFDILFGKAFCSKKKGNICSMEILARPGVVVIWTGNVSLHFYCNSTNSRVAHTTVLLLFEQQTTSLQLSACLVAVVNVPVPHLCKPHFCIAFLQLQW